jgi:putative ABC transport system ATP-binding protein
VAIARAILGGPSIILADEPTGNLDSKTSAEIVQLLHDLNRQGSTIVVVTHDLDVASAIPREIHLQDGLIESDQSKSLV